MLYWMHLCFGGLLGGLVHAHHPGVRFVLVVLVFISSLLMMYTYDLKNKPNAYLVLQNEQIVSRFEDKETLENYLKQKPLENFQVLAIKELEVNLKMELNQ